MRILIVSAMFHAGELGGAGTYAYLLSKELVRQGHHVDVIANLTGPMKGQTPFTIYELKLSKLRIIGILKWTIAAYVYSRRLMRKNNYDIVHEIHFMTNMYRLMWSSRIPMVTTIQQGWALTSPAISRPRRIVEFLIELAVCKKYAKTIVLNRHHEFELLRWGFLERRLP